MLYIHVHYAALTPPFDRRLTCGEDLERMRNFWTVRINLMLTWCLYLASVKGLLLVRLLNPLTSHQ